MRLRLSVWRLSLDLGRKPQLKDEYGKGTVGCGSGWNCCGGWFGMWWEGKGGDAKTCFSAGHAAHVHCFKDIRQGALYKSTKKHERYCRKVARFMAHSVGYSVYEWMNEWMNEWKRKLRYKPYYRWPNAWFSYNFFQHCCARFCRVISQLCICFNNK